MFNLLAECALDALTDGLRLLPFLFLTYLCMELLEKHEGEKLESVISRAGKFGPVWGSVLGVVPQCGFSAAASSLYAGHVITIGALIAVFFSTSDEMLPIFISEAVPVTTILKILLCKVILAIISGYFVQIVFSKYMQKEKPHMDIHSVCEHEHCDCHDGPFKSAVRHTIKIVIYIVIISLVLNFLAEMVGEESISSFFTAVPVLGVFAAAIVGLIPNCASSVLLTRLYLMHLITPGALIGGLLVGAGVGLLVLFRLNQNRKENGMIVGMMLILGILWGVLIDLLGIVF